MKKIISIILTIISLQLYSQNQKKIDSLLNIYDAKENTEKKVEAAHHLFKIFKHKNPEKAYGYANDALDLSKNRKYEKGINFKWTSAL